MEKKQCSVGWSHRCFNAKEGTCVCACGGENHGKGRLNGLRPDVVILDEAGPDHFVHVRNMVEGFAFTGDVTINGLPLMPEESQKYRNHSPDGFAWGYGGSGPAQLALAILLRLTTPQKAQNLYQQFKSDVIATLPQDKDFKITIAFIKDWIAQQ